MSRIWAQTVSLHKYYYAKLDLFLFVDHSDADDAIHDLDGKDLMGGRVKLEFAKDPRDRRDRGGDRRDFGGRDGGRDRGGYGGGRDGGRNG